MSEPNLDVLAKLREPFPPEQVGKLPKGGVTLDFVGHGWLTARFLDVDPGWNWEPVAYSGDGLPLLDEHGGLWIRLTIGGVTRLGYGDAGGKSGPNAIKEAIGDALRNAGMRFGAALLLWCKGDPDAHERGPRRGNIGPSDEAVAAANEARGALLVALEPHGWTGKALCERFLNDYGKDLLAVTDVKLIDTFGAALASEVGRGPAGSPDDPINDRQLRKLHTMLSKNNITDRDARVQWCADLLGVPVTSTKNLTSGEAERLLDKLDRMP